MKKATVEKMNPTIGREFTNLGDELELRYHLITFGFLLEEETVFLSLNGSSLLWEVVNTRKDGVWMDEWIRIDMEFKGSGNKWKYGEDNVARR